VAYEDLYDAYLQQMPESICKHKQLGHKYVLGYTSDLDVIIEWNADTFDDIFSAYINEEPFLAAGDVIDSVASFARIVCYYIIHGLGGEIEITSLDVCDYIESHFKTTYALGGTCAQGAAALNAVGFPVVAHITDRSREVCRLMDGPGIEVVTPQSLVPIMEGASSELPVRHIILQYTKGERVVVNGVERVVPLSNRLIMDFDTIHKDLPVDQCFLDYCESRAKDMLVYCVSGFNAIVDAGIMGKRAEELVQHYKAVKKQNPDCMIYLEGAYYLNSDLKDLVFDKLSGSIDIFGMNEEELVDHTNRHGFRTDKDDLASVLEGLSIMIERYPIRGIVLHTKDYSMYYGDPIKGADLAKGLTLGNLMSGTKARTGRYGSLEDCRETMRLPLSPAGLAFWERLSSIRTKKSAYMVPSRYMERPRCTIGLGDTFMAGFLISFEG
jgi:ADP-dependent phosphofructokinase/glucokinase